MMRKSYCGKCGSYVGGLGEGDFAEGPIRVRCPKCSQKTGYFRSSGSDMQTAGSKAGEYWDRYLGVDDPSECEDAKKDR